jgi:hypothetical protein
MALQTNELYRKKYFVNTEKVLFSKEQNALPKYPMQLSAVISADRVKQGNHPVPIRYGNEAGGNEIKVTPIKDNQRVKELHIACACGRHTELNVEYEP